MSFLCDFSQIRRRVYIPFRPVGIDILHTEMQMFPGRPCSRIARCAEPSAGLYRIADLDGNLLEVHIGTLYLAAVRPGIFHRQRLAAGRILVLVYRHDLAAVLRSQYRIAFATYIHALVHLLLCAVQRVLPCSERRGNEQKFLPFHRERIPRSMFRTLGSLERIVFHPELPALCRHLLHHLSVILLQAVLLNDFLQVLGILAACGVTGFLNALCPALVIVRGEFEATGIAAVLLQKAGVMLV